MLERERPISIPLEGGLFATVTVTAVGRSGLELVAGWLVMLLQCVFVFLVGLMHLGS